MTPLPRRRPPGHTVIVDTSILWHRDKANVVAPEFEAFWQEHSSTGPLKLVVPGVVRGEILFQQTSSALKALERANQSIRDVSVITEKSYSHRVTEERVRAQVVERFDRWLSSKSAYVAIAPVQAIDWAAVVRAAIWREPPFSFDPKNPDHEKGFRDCLILETIAHHVEQNRDPVAFICNDRLLREATEARLVNHASCSCYDSLNDFASYMRLMQQRMNDRFVKSILSRARKKFFVKRDPRSLYYKAGIYKRIAHEYADALEVEEERTIDIRSALWGRNSTAWVRFGQEQVRISNTQFERLDEPSTFRWVTPLTFIRPFRHDPGSDQANSVRMEKVLTVSFIVRWHAYVTRSGAFRACEIDTIEFRDRTFDVLTPEQRERFGLTRSGE